MSHPNKKRLRRSMMFLNCQKPGLIKDPYIYKPDSLRTQLLRTRKTQQDIPYIMHYRRSITEALSGLSVSMVWTLHTGKKISVSV